LPENDRVPEKGREVAGSRFPALKIILALMKAPIMAEGKYQS
jgi:hypothetical protein